MGSDGGFVDISQLLSPPSASLVQEEAILFLGHRGTLRERCQLPLVITFNIDDKHARFAESAPALNNITSASESAQNTSRCDITPSSFGLDSYCLEPHAAHLTSMQSLSPQPLPTYKTTKNSTQLMSRSFNPPRDPRSRSALQPICFYFYHKGYCKPKRGGRCDYFHGTNTFQQTVSLPHVINNYDPRHSLPLCPVLLHNPAQIMQEPGAFVPAPSVQAQLKHKLSTLSRTHGSTLIKFPDSMPHDMVLPAQSSFTMGQHLP